MTNTNETKVAVPVMNGKLGHHFGQSRAFRIFRVVEGKIAGWEDVDVPAGGEGSCCSRLASLLQGQGVKVVISGGMGGCAMAHLGQAGVQVFTVSGESDPEQLVGRYIAGSLESRGATCDHHHGHGHGHGHGEGGGCGGHQHRHGQASGAKQ